MLEAFNALPDGAYVPTPMPALAGVATVSMVMKVERHHIQMKWFRHEPTWAPHVMVHLPLRGTVLLREANGQQTLCSPGHMLLDRRPHHAEHKNFCQEGVFRNCWSGLGGSAVLAAADAAIAAHGTLVDLTQRPEIWRQIHDWFRIALCERRADAATLGSQAFAWLTQLCTWRSPSGVAAALALIEREFDDPDLDIARLARTAGCATSTFSRRFHAAFGAAPYHYLRQRRIDRARERLFGGEPIAAIARQCGFRDAAHFIHNFRAATGDSPHRYRRKHQP